MILYLETSAHLKLYVKEPEAPEVRRAINRADTVCTHLIAYAEMRSGLAKAKRLGRINESALASHKSELEHDWMSLTVLLADDRVIRRAGELCERFGLRAYDGVHVAAAESLLLEPGGRYVRFLSFDDALNGVAIRLGLRLGTEK